MMLRSVKFGPAFPPLETEIPKDFVRWWILNIGGRLARIGSRSDGEARWPFREGREKLEQAYKGKLVGMLVEPTYDHNGYFDPGGGFIWEDEYQEWIRTLSKKIGVLHPQAFVVCPECNTAHTAPTRTCRNCEFKL